MIEEPNHSTIDTIVRILNDARSILFITGAGMSADSGIPTYRGIGGLYNVDTTEDGYPIEEIMSSSMLAQNPALTWKYLSEIGKAAAGAKFNRGHEVIAEIEEHFDRVWTVTQNVDGFHSDAGAKNVVEAHGSMHSLSCTKCDFEVQAKEFEITDLPPKCPWCGAVVRPDVVLFGELLSGKAVNTMQREVVRGFDVVFSIGTTSVFPYIQEPLKLARQQGNPSVEINPRETSVTHLVDYHLSLGASEALDEIWNRFRSA